MYNTDSPLIKEIQTLIQAEANNNPAPEKATITKIYNDGNVDAETNNGIISYADCIGTPTIRQTGLVCYADGDLNNPVFITKTTIPTTIKWENITDKPSTYPSAWNDITGKPTTYPTKTETWNATNNNYNTAYIDTGTGNTNYLRYTRIGQIATISFYFTLKNTVTTSYNNIAYSIPSEFQPVNDTVQIISNTSGVHFGLELTEGYVKLKHYSTSFQGGVIAGTISYRCTGDSE